MLHRGCVCFCRMALSAAKPIDRVGAKRWASHSFSPSYELRTIRRAGAAKRIPPLGQRRRWPLRVSLRNRRDDSRPTRALCFIEATLTQIAPLDTAPICLTAGRTVAGYLCAGSNHDVTKNVHALRFSRESRVFDPNNNGRGALIELQCSAVAVQKIIGGL